MRRLSELEKSEVWDRFEAGESQRSISRRLGRSPSSIRSLLLGSGFRRPLPGPEWSALRLSLTEREEISRGLATGESLRGIAAQLGRAGSTVSREVASNGGRHKYRATTAHRTSRHRARRPKPAKLASNHQLRELVEAKLPSHRNRGYGQCRVSPKEPERLLDRAGGIGLAGRWLR